MPQVREEKSDLSKAAAPQYLDKAERMLEVLHSFSNGLDRKLYLMEQYPSFAPRFWDNHMGRLMRMDAIQLMTVLGVPDPTGERAVRRVMASQGSRL